MPRVLCPGAEPSGQQEAGRGPQPTCPPTHRPLTSHPAGRGLRGAGPAASETLVDAQGAAGDVLQLPGHVVGHADAVVRQHFQHQPQVQPPLLPGHAVPVAGSGVRALRWAQPPPGQAPQPNSRRGVAHTVVSGAPVPLGPNAGQASTLTGNSGACEHLGLAARPAHPPPPCPCTPAREGLGPAPHLPGDSLKVSVLLELSDRAEGHHLFPQADHAGRVGGIGKHPPCRHRHMP